MSVFIYLDVVCPVCHTQHTLQIDVVSGDVRRGVFVGADESRRLWTLPCQHVACLSGSEFRFTPVEIPWYGLPHNRRQKR
jgi:hypothetical protein